MKKSELLLNPYKEHLKKPYLHGAGTLEIDGVQYSADEYITMLEEANKSLKNELMEDMKTESKLNEEIKKLKSDLNLVIDERDNAFKKVEQLKEDIDNGFNRETDLRNKRADSLLENKDLRDKIEELETDYDRLKVAFEDVVSGK